MNRISEEEITNIRNRADIVEVVGRYVSLKKQGRNFVAVCPFHDDHNPSMSISPEKQIYKCFVCGAGGNVFTFVQNFENVSFQEAVQKVADSVGIHIELVTTKADSVYDKKTLSQFDIMDESIRFLNYQLTSQDGIDAMEYLKNRGITLEAIKYFDVGFDKENQLSNFLLKKGYQAKELETLDLIRQHEERYYDVFHNRVVFPIHDSLGKPLGFSGRAFQSEEQVKYINSKETQIYRKGDVLYNYHRAKDTARKSEEVFLVEGVIDVVAFYLAGIKNVVASLGTAFTKEQMRLLRLLAKKVVLCYDGDKAGRMASYKVGKLLIQNRLNFEFVKTLDGLDPDDFRRKHGNELFTTAIEKRMTWIEFLMDYLPETYDVSNYSDKKKYALEIAQEISKLEDDFDRENYFQRLATTTGFTIEVLKQSVSQSGKIEEFQTRNQEQKRKSSTRIERAEYTIIAQLLSSKEACGYFQKDLGFLLNAQLNKVVLLVLDYYRNHDTMNVADLMSILDEESISIVTDISESEMYPLHFDKKILAEAINIVKVALIDSKMKEIRAELNKVAKDNGLSEELIALKRERDKLIHLKEE
jgi:DNA primase, catalytic core